MGGGGFGGISGADTSTISGGSKNRIQGDQDGDSGTSSGNTITGGSGNKILFLDPLRNCVITGGWDNFVTGRGAVVAGGTSNRASGSQSLAFGQGALAEFDHSMVVNLMDNTYLEAT